MTAGALSIDASTDLTLSRSSFTGNSAGSPVGVLQGALYEGRSYGGALHAYASTLLLTGMGVAVVLTRMPRKKSSLGYQIDILQVEWQQHVDLRTLCSSMHGADMTCAVMCPTKGEKH